MLNATNKALMLSAEEPRMWVGPFKTQMLDLALKCLPGRRTCLFLKCVDDELKRVCDVDAEAMPDRFNFVVD